MPTTWVDAVRASHAHLVPARGQCVAPPVPVSTWLGAVLLDDARWPPELLLDGVSLIVCGDRAIADAVRAAVLTALRGAANQPQAWSGAPIAPDGGVLVIGAAAAADEYDAAVDVGGPVVIVTDRIDEVRPASAVALADRRLQLPHAARSGVLEALTKVVYGGAVVVSPRHVERLGTPDLLRCVPLGGNAADCEARIRRLLASMDVEAAGQRTVGVVGVAPPAEAATAGDVVRKLSEMTGFGEAGVWGLNLARDLADLRAGRLPWRDVDRGVLLSGPPGSGKTTFARALALECGVDLVSTNYGAWASGTGGDMVQRGLAKLFDAWRARAASGPFILFWDEVDSVGRRNSTSSGDYWFGPIINSWLAFLDGAIPRDGIVVVGATNHPDNVDAALRRPGRLDRHVELPMPDVAALAGIVRAHLGEDAILDEAELAEAARAVRGRSPAEIGLLAREARRVARWCGRRVCAGDLTDVLAAQRLARGVSPETERETAVHEAGHAVAATVVGVDRLVSVDLDRAVTTTVQAPYWTRAAAEARLTAILAARAAEELILGASTSGAQADLRDATALATGIHAAWGWGAAGLASVAAEVARSDPDVRSAVRATLDEAYGRAMSVVREHRGAIERVAEGLLGRRYLDGAEVRALVAGPEPPASRAAAGRARRVGRRIPPGI